MKIRNYKKYKIGSITFKVGHYYSYKSMFGSECQCFKLLKIFRDEFNELIFLVYLLSDIKVGHLTQCADCPLSYEKCCIVDRHIACLSAKYYSFSEVPKIKGMLILGK